jgi:ABC-type enterochelin transport system substrate-binding protein
MNQQPKEAEEREEIFDLAVQVLEKSKKPETAKTKLIEDIGKITSMDLMVIEAKIDQLKDLQSRLKKLQRKFGTLDETDSHETISNEVRKIVFLSARVEEKLEECEEIAGMLRNHNILLVQKIIDHLVSGL